VNQQIIANLQMNHEYMVHSHILGAMVQNLANWL